jgi:hypothetical protein
MRRLAILFLALLALFLGFSTESLFAEEQTVTVTADGYSYLGDNDTIKIARERALAEAERNAVEQGSSTYLESQTTVKNYQLDSDEIRSRVKGVITAKKILVDEMQKDTLRYHIRLEATVQVADLESLQKQPQVSSVPAKDSPPRSEASPAPVTVSPQKPADKGQAPSVHQLRRLRKLDPHQYIAIMTRIQPKLNNTNAFLVRLRQVESRYPEASGRVRNMLNHTPVRGIGKRKLTKRIRYLKAERPQEYILMMEILFPEVRPQAIERRLARNVER